MACQSDLHYTVIDMPKKTHFNQYKKHMKRILGLGIAGLFVLTVAFIYTNPTLAPESGNNLYSGNSKSTDENAGNIFDIEEQRDVNPELGENVNATSYLVYDESTGKILASRNPNSTVAIASITKLMTAYVTQKYGNLDEVWAITAKSTSTIKPVLNLTVGDRVLVKDLVNAMLIGSANDSAAALGEYVSSVTKQPIIDLMNFEAKNLGMESTHYENPIGFDSEQNYSSANDLKRLLKIINVIPLFSDIDRKQTYTFTSLTGQTYSVKATNTLIADDPDIHAIKTGFTDEAQGAMITAIHHQDKKFVIIVLGSTNREKDTKLLKTKVLELYK